MLAPGRRDDPVQFIDVRDLAEFMVHLLEDGRSGVYNVVGPKAALTMPAFLEQAARRSAQSEHSPGLTTTRSSRSTRSKRRFRGRCSRATTTG